MLSGMSTQSLKDARFQQLRTQASDFSSTNTMGILICRTIEAMESTRKNGGITEDLEFNIKAIEMELKLAIDEDGEKNSQLRELLFSFCLGLKSMMESILDMKKQDEFNEAYAISPSAEIAAVSSEKTKKRIINKPKRVKGINPKQKEMRCPLCGKGHYKINLLYGHLKHAHQTNPKKAGLFFRCDCGRSVQSDAHRCDINLFTVVSDEEMGVRIKTNRTENRGTQEKLMQCPQCKNAYYNIRTLVAHLKMAHNLTPVQAGIAFHCECGVLFRTERAHEMCKISNFTIVPAADVGTEGERNKENKELSGGDTAAATSDPAATAATAATAVPTAIHKYTNAPLNGRRCTNCNRFFINAQAFKRHTQSDNLCGTRCRECLKVFKPRLALTQHTRLQHGSAAVAADAAAAAKKRFKCAECGATFSSRNTHQAHQANAHRAKRFACDLCDAKFGHATDYRRHMTHKHGWKMQECNICNEKFTKFEELKEHKLVSH